MYLKLTHTTPEAIMRRLKGRLELYGSTAFGRTEIDSELLEQVAEQAEARLNNVLQSRYQLPLKTAHPTLAEYVEQRCVCTIIPVYFQRQNVSDDRGLGETACKEAAMILAELEDGKIRLEGETLIPSQPTRYSDGHTFVQRRTIKTAENLEF
jgi:phage gp36-like protein